MLFYTCQWLGAYLSLGPVGSLYSSIARKGAGVLSGWNAVMRTGAGICDHGLGCQREEKGNVKTKTGDYRPEVPNFVLDYAPYVYLYSQEIFLPGDIGEHLRHTIPYLNYSPVPSYNAHQSLTSLEELNQFGCNIYLTSDDNPEYPPEWLRGDRNKPIPAGSPDAGMSAAPAIIIWVNKPDNITDVFYFYFYSFNLGNTVAGWRFGNHVGDWEHTAVRFLSGVPQAMFFSEHGQGAAYEYAAVEKIGRRPVAYSARGSHANYARPGIHYYAIPFHLLSDVADKGPLWDVTMNSYVYEWDMDEDVLTPSERTPEAPTGWFHYQARWGDRVYPMSDSRQYRVAGQYHYVTGPTGPKSKNLARVEICQNKGVCVVQSSLTGREWGGEGGEWGGSGSGRGEGVEVVHEDDGHVMPEEDCNLVG